MTHRDLIEELVARLENAMDVAESVANKLTDSSQWKLQAELDEIAANEYTLELIERAKSFLEEGN